MIRHFTKSWPCYQTGPHHRFWRYYLIPGGSDRTFAKGAAIQQRTLTPPHTWSCPIWGLAFVLMLRPFIPELVMSTDFLSFQHPSVLLFCFLAFTTPILTSRCPQTFSTLSVFLHTLSTSVFPLTHVMATTSTSGLLSAIIMACASSTPVSQSMIIFCVMTLNNTNTNTNHLLTRMDPDGHSTVYTLFDNNEQFKT